MSCPPASSRHPHGSPPPTTSPRSPRPLRCARHRQGPPPPRPTSPRTRFAPPLRHSATWAFPAFGPVRPSTSCLAETSLRPHTLTARRLRRHRPAHAVRLAALVVSSHGSVSASPCELRPSQASALRTPSASAPLPDLPAQCVAPPPPTPSEPSALHASPRPAPAPSMTTPIVDAPTSSVCRSSTPCRASTSRQPFGSPPPAASPRSRRPPRCARRRRRSRPRRWRGLRFIFVAGDAVHIHDAADHRGNVRPVPFTTPAATTPVNVSVMTIMARQLHRGAHCTSKPLTAAAS